MALTLPLHFFDTVCRCCGSLTKEGTSKTAKEMDRLADFLIANASLFDVIRWRRISKAFRRAAETRLRCFTRVDVRIYNGLHKLQNHHCGNDSFEWHPNAAVMIMETGPNRLGIAVDSNMKGADVRALLQLLAVFRNVVEQLFMDSPIIDLLMSQINRQQVNMLVEALRVSRKTSFGEIPTFEQKSVAAFNGPPVFAYGPFFPNLKKLTITSRSNELEHLSRLSTYAVGVDFLYETANIDVLCLKIILGGRWCHHKSHVRMFKHVTRFRQWTEADSLGERYFQQFSGSGSPRSF